MGALRKGSRSGTKKTSHQHSTTGCALTTSKSRFAAGRAAAPSAQGASLAPEGCTDKSTANRHPQYPQQLGHPQRFWQQQR
eukprot:359849-Chlamydomonas_euryale.AAC.2